MLLLSEPQCTPYHCNNVNDSSTMLMLELFPFLSPKPSCSCVLARNAHHPVVFITALIFAIEQVFLVFTSANFFFIGNFCAQRKWKNVCMYGLRLWLCPLAILQVQHFVLFHGKNCMLFMFMGMALFVYDSPLAIFTFAIIIIFFLHFTNLQLQLPVLCVRWIGNCSTMALDNNAITQN